MANSVVAIVSLLVLTLAVRGNAQMCYFSRSCAGFSIPSPLDQCVTGLSHEDENGVCTTFPVEFGFAQTTLIGDEQAEDYEIEFGFLQGRFDQELQVTIDPIYHTASASDIRLSGNRRTFAVRSTDTDRVVLSLEIDSVAQEINETLTLRLNFDEALFDLPTDTLITELNVTIIDTESIELRFSEDDYRATEGRNDVAPVTILKDSAIRLANPVTFRIIPLTVDQAIDQGIIDMNFPPEEGISIINILRSPIRANEQDFNTTAFTVTLPSDEDVASPENELDAFVSIVDDELNERSDQYFIVTLEVIDAVNPAGVDIIQGVTRVIIGDNDDIHIGFARELYQYFEPSSETVITNLTLVKDNNRVSEQTFRIGINVNDPATDVAAATLETLENTGTDEWDYRVGFAGQDFLQRDIFPAEQSLLVAFVLTGDNVPEGLEGFQLDASVETEGGFPQFALPLQSSTTAFRSTVVTIVDDDVVIVGWEQPSYTFNETDRIPEICVIVISPTPTQNLAFEILLQYTPQSGTADMTDYFLLTSPANLNFPISSPTDPPTNRTVCVNEVGFNLLLLDDDISEETESFTLELSIRVPGTEINITPAITEIFILDDDVVTFGFIDAPYEANEADGVTFVRVGLIGMPQALGRNVSILLTFSETGSALNGSDYSAPVDGQILQFGPGNIVLDIPLSLIDDDVFELTETLQASLSFPGGIDTTRVNIDPDLDIANITIFDEDVLLFGFDNDTYRLREDAGPAMTSVSLMSGDPGEFEVRLNVETDDSYANATALAGLDYESTTSQLIYSSSVRSFNFDIPIILDELKELIEFFRAIIIRSDFSLLSGGAEIALEPQQSDRIQFAITEALIFIIDSNRARIGFVQTTYSSFEGEGPIIFEFGVLEGNLTFDVSVLFFTSNGTANADVDYFETDSTFTLTGTEVVTVPVDLVNDTTVEPSEIFFGNILSVDGLIDNVDFDPILATATIRDDDVVIIGFVPDTYQVNEAEGVVTFMIELITGVLDKDIVVEFFTEDGSAEGLGDYANMVVNVTFGPGMSFATVNIPIVNDTLYENDEVFYGNLRLPAGVVNGVQFDPMRANVTIFDDDFVIIGYIEPYEVTEGTNFTVDIVFQLLEGELGRDVEVLLFTANDTALDQADYMDNSEIVTFTPTQNSFILTVGIVDDDIVENPEVFLAMAELVSAADAGDVIIAPESTTVTILDEDRALIGFSQGAYDIFEAERVVNVTIVLMGLTAVPLTVILDTRDDTAISSGSGSGRDFIPIMSLAVTFFPSADDRQENVVQINVLDDIFVEDDETLSSVVSLTAADDAIDLNPAVANITILNDDMVVIGFEETFQSYQETDNFVVIRFGIISGALRIPLQVFFTTADDTAIAGPDGDYLEISPVLPFIFNSVNDSYEVMVPLVDNDIQEPVEQFLGQLSSPEDPNILTLMPAVTTIEIVDDDAVVFTFREEVNAFNESDGLATIIVDKVGLTDQTVVLMVTGPLQAETGMRIDQEITFGPNDTEVLLQFMIQDDGTALEPSEEFEWVLNILSPMDDGVSIMPFNVTTILIVDDDELVLSLDKPGMVPESMNSTSCIEFSTDFATDFNIDAMPSPPENVEFRATPGEDYTAPPMSLLAEAFNHGPANPLCFETPIVDDEFVEYEECFAVAISLPSPDTDDLLVSIADGNDTVTCCIEDDDTVTIGLLSDLFEFNEDDPENVTVVSVGVLNGTLQRPVDVTLLLDEVLALVGEDFIDTGPINITLDENTTSVDISVLLLDDQIHELDEELVLLLETSEDPSVVVLAPESAVLTIMDNDEVMFTFRQPFIMFPENVGNVTVYIDKSGSTALTIVLNVTGPLQLETGEVIDQQVVFGPNDTEVQINFIVEDDMIALEETEMLEWLLALAEDIDRASVDPYNTTTINIVDDDDLVLSLNKSGQVPEAENATACITFSAPFATDFTISSSPSMPENVTVPGLASPGEDYMAPPMTLEALASTYGPGSDLCFQIPIVADDYVELEECFAVSISLNDTGLMVSIEAGEDTSVCCIVDDDRVTIGFEDVSISVNEPDGVATLTVVVLDRLLQRPVEVFLSTADNTATSSGVLDFLNLTDLVLEFDEDTLALEINVTIIDDDILENFETFFANLDTDDPQVVLAPDSAEVEIRDINDEITVGFDPTDYEVNEADGTAILFVVLLNGTLERNVTVLFETASDSATQDAPADYEATSVLLTFSPDVDVIPVPVSIINDTIVEGNETFVGLLDAQGQPVIVDPPREQAMVLITEDPADEVVIGFEETVYPSMEGEEVTVCVVLVSGELERDVVVRVSSADGTATGGDDYVPVVGEELTFNADTARECFNFTTIEDDVLEPEENVSLILMSDDPMVVTEPELSEVIISDTNRVVVGLEETVLFIDEEDGATIQVCVVLVEGTVDRDVTVNIATSDGTATSIAPMDYEALNVDLTFVPGEIPRVCDNVTVLNDDISENPEDFFVTLSTTDPSAEVDPDRDVATATINDLDEIVIGFVLEMDNVLEDDGFIDILVEVKNFGQLERNVTVMFFTVDGTGDRPALDDSDYNSTTASLLFLPGQETTPLSVRVPINTDGDLEGPEIFFADLMTDEERVTLDPNRTTIVIIDADEISVGFVDAPYQGLEESEFATLTIAVMGAELGTELLVNLTTEDIGEAIAGVDYEPLDIVLTFSEDVRTIQINVTLIDDNFLEGDEDFMGSLEILTTGTNAQLVPGTETAIVTILDNDMVVIGMDETMVNVDEDIGQRELCASIMSGELMREVQVMVVYADRTASDGDDYTSMSHTLTFGPDVDDQQCFNVTIVDDDVYELREDFFVNLTTSEPLVTLMPTTTVVMIDDEDEVIIGWVLPSYQAAEADGSVEICAELVSGAASVGSVLPLVNIVLTDGTAIVGTDTGMQTSPTFFNFQSTTPTTMCTTVTLIADDILEDPEHIFANLEIPTTPRVVIDPPQTQVNITDSDTAVIGFDPENYQVFEEDGVATLFVAVLDGTLDTEVEVQFDTLNGDAMDPNDFTATTVLLLFSPTQTRVPVNVTIIDDDVVERNETFPANLTLISDNDRVTIDPPMATVLIIDNDVPVIGFEQTQHVIVEVENDTAVIQVCVALMPPPSLDREVTVSLSSQNGTAEEPNDYNSVMADLVFNADNDVQCVNVTANEDDIIEGTENFTLVLDSDDNVLLLPEEAEVQIMDLGSILVMFAEPVYTFNEEDGLGIIELVKSASVSQPFTVRVFGGPSNQSDIERSADGIDIIVEFDAGLMAPGSIFINFTLTDDEIALEADETYNVQFEILETLGDIVRPGILPQTQVIVLDPDVVNVGFGRPSVTVNESDGEFMMCVLKDRETVFPVEVTISTSPDTAIEGADYDPANVPSSVTIPADENMTCFTTDTVLDDILALEEDEVFLLDIENVLPDDPRINVEADNVTVTILDDDVPTIGFEQTQYSVRENDTVGTEVCVSVMAPPSLGSTVTVMLVSMDGTAQAPDDFAAVMEDLVFGADIDLLCVNITATGDDVAEGMENFTLALASDNNDVILMPEQADVEILDSGMIFVMFAEPVYTYNEEDGVGTIEIVKTGATSEPFTVRVYGGPSNQTDIERSADGIDIIVEFQAGPSAPDSIFINFTLTDDEVALEADETYDVRFEILETLGDIVQPGILLETQVVVLDPDVVSVGFGRPNVTRNESDGQFTMCVVKDRDTAVPVVVTISTADGTATEGQDFDPANVPATVIIDPDSAMECFDSNAILDDEVALEDEEFFLLLAELLDPDDPRVNLTDPETMVIILDDDVVSVQFEQPTYTYDETDGSAQVCLVKDAETATSFTVDNIVTEDGTAMDGVDYTGGPYSVMFDAPADDIKCIMINLTVDNVDEDTENFVVSLAELVADEANVLVGVQNVTTVNIVDRGVTIFVNDTVIGDPLFTVPIYVPEDQLDAMNLSQLFLCYEIHGVSDQWFNLVTDECTSVNARYGMFNQDLNVIDEIGVRAVDTADQCVNIRVDVGNCTADVNDVALDVMGRYSMNGVSVRRYRNRVRISVPNCNDLTLVMWVFCETRTLQDPFDGSEVTGDMIKFVVMRGLNTGNRPSHGLLGQFWNIPVSIAPYTGLLRDNSVAEGRFVINITTSGSDPPVQRSYTGWLYDLTWEFQEGPCLYVGNRQAGPIYEVMDPNDNVIEDRYKNYKVDSAFSEEGFDFGIFMEERCDISVMPTTEAPSAVPTTEAPTSEEPTTGSGLGSGIGDEPTTSIP